MIFVTVGSQLPFGRLIDAMDGLAAVLDEDIVAQTGQIGPWQNLSTVTNLAPDAFAELFMAARVVVAHAGIGTVLSAERYRIPLILVPRRHILGEHRNDHQMATARALEGRTGIYVAWQVDAVADLLNRSSLMPVEAESNYSRDTFLIRLKRILEQS